MGVYDMLKGVSLMPRNVQPSRLGAVIAAKRKMMGLSQRQLAEKIGLNNATISKLEKDPSLDPDIRTIQLLADALGLDYTYLLSLNETVKDDRDLRIIARAKENMTPEEQERMMQILRTTFDTAFANAESDGIDEAELF
jgi:transcriptional regulator with XRE-family HTH domain